jgi:exopolyphosphatase/pppGpp-phosphohydrolase
MNVAEGSPLRATLMVEETLRQNLAWLAETRGDLVVIGRAMRLLGKMLLGDDTSGKTVGRESMLALAVDLLTGRMAPEQVKQYPGYETRLPYRGAVVQAMLKVAPLERVRFADYALREGVFLTQTGQRE